MAKKITKSYKTKKRIVNIIVHVFLAILAFIWVMPIFWVILTSFRKEPGSYIDTFFPKHYTFNNYIKLFTDTNILNFPRMFMNTLVIAIFSCIISTFFVLSVAYCMSRLRFKLRKPFMNVAMILGLFPGFMSMVAVYYILKAIGLSDDEARASLRLSFGRFTKDDDIDVLINEITTKVPKLVEAGSMWNVR